MKNILIAGFGNLLRGDDGFGVEVVRLLARTGLPESVETFEAGSGGVDLVLKLMEGFEEVIVVDAVQRGQPPGTLYVFTPPEGDLAPRRGERIDPHSASPTATLRMAAGLGVLPKRVTVVGCEPGDWSVALTLSPAVREAVDRAAEQIRKITETRR